MPTETTPPNRFLAACRRLWRKLTLADAPPRLGSLLAAFFGDDLDKVETHDKGFPGYDLASLHRALASFRADCCLEHR